jgi:hypothetical protein
MQPNGHKAQSRNTFKTLPPANQVVTTDQGPAMYVDGAWLVLTPPQGCTASTATAAITWWREQDGTTHSTFPILKVITGVRLFTASGWTRKDRVEVHGELIGIIKMHESHGPSGTAQKRSTTTICLANSAQVATWNPGWCFEEHQRVAAQRQEEPECC